MTELERLAAQYRTDKGDPNHACDGVSYIQAYHEQFNPIRFRVKRVLEIGVHKGASLKMWRDYFPSAEVWGMDINPNTETNLGPRIHVVVGDQSDLNDLHSISADKQFDIIIDDGSHLVDHIVASHEILWPSVAAGGFYVIEDTTCANGDLTNVSKGWPGMKYNKPGTSYVNDRKHLNDWLIRQAFAAEHGRRGIGNMRIRFNQFWFQKQTGEQPND